MGNDRHLCSRLEPKVVGGTTSAKATGAAAVLILFLWQPSDPGFARERASAAKTQNNNDKDEKNEIDTEEIFGFSEGSDVGDAGRRRWNSSRSAGSASAAAPTPPPRPSSR
jgi:hypothetical protein